MENTTTTIAVLPTEELTALLTETVRRAIGEALAEERTPPPRDRNQRLTFDEARVRLRMSRPSLLRLITSGQLPAHKTNANGQWIISERSLEAYLGGGE